MHNLDRQDERVCTECVWQNLSHFIRPTKWEDNIKTDLREIGFESGKWM